MAGIELIPVDTHLLPAARCAVCGDTVEPGHGLAVSRDGIVFRFKCAGCLERFSADPDRFLSEHPTGCCRERGSGPASEWTCD